MLCFKLEVILILQLDEKKVRKGKPVGLPYIGSKKKISKKIVEIIKQNFGTDLPVYDVFGGGGAITAELLLNGIQVHYNDLDSDITRMFMRVISKDREWIKTLIVSRNEFLIIRDKKEKTVDDNLKLLVNSFGNNSSSYLYAKKCSDTKYNLAVEIINKHDVFAGCKKTETYQNTIKQLQRLEQLERLKQLQQLERLQQLEQLGQLERLQQLGQLGQLEITNHDYTAFSNVKNAVFYLDPPYENTEKAYKFEFNHEAFYDWCVEMAKKNIVIISSYNVSDPRFEVAFEFKKAHGSLAGGQNEKYERLYMVKKK